MKTLNGIWRIWKKYDWIFATLALLILAIQGIYYLIR